MDAEIQYLDLLHKVLQAPVRGDRTGTGTHSIFGHQMRFENIANEFPLITSKFVPLRVIFHELKWMLMGSTNIKYLVDNNVSIWTDWPFKNWWLRNNPELTAEDFDRFKKEKPTEFATLRSDFEETIRDSGAFANKWGDCGPVYGYQWRRWRNEYQKDGFTSNRDEIDQFADVIQQLKKNPESRRMIINAWNVADIPAMIPSGLPPCHMMMQFYTREIPLPHRYVMTEREAIQSRGKSLGESEHNYIDRISKGKVPRRYLDCQVYIRSNDLYLGAPFNMAQYALLIHLMAHHVGMVPGELVYTVGDAHIYSNHIDQVKELLSRYSSIAYKLPTLTVTSPERNDIADYEWENLRLENYNYWPALKADIAV